MFYYTWYVINSQTCYYTRQHFSVSPNCIVGAEVGFLNTIKRQKLYKCRKIFYAFEMTIKLKLKICKIQLQNK